MTLRLEEGLLWPSLAEMICRHSIHLVIVGTHGRTSAKRLLLGSAAEEIFRLAECPVMTVGPRVRTEPPAEVELRHILFATDFTPNSERAAAYAFSLAQEHQAHLTLLHVVEHVEDLSTKNMSVLREIFTRRLRGILPPDGCIWCQPDFAVTLGDAAEEILAVGRERESDLIVLGVRRAAEFAGHLPAGRAYKVVCQTRCPALTVRG